MLKAEERPRARGWQNPRRGQLMHVKDSRTVQLLIPDGAFQLFIGVNQPVKLLVHNDSSRVNRNCPSLRLDGLAAVLSHLQKLRQ